ncbi:MAG: RraA family protein [Proteobacteria bacterium]|nr:RraA family protein [Pseudomonadota bacterium]
MAKETAFDRIKKHLFTSVLSDSLDSVGIMNQAMSPRIRPLDEASVMVGRARTGLYREVFHIDPTENPYELEIQLIDDLKPGEIAVLACGHSGKIAPWGELLSTASKVRGAAGCLTDGLTRDIKKIRAMGFPVFHGGIGPLDSKGRGKVVAIDVPVEVDGVKVESGDLVFGDADGVVVIPRKIEKKVLKAAFEKVLGENKTLADLKRGDKLGTVFKRYGIL